MATTANSPSWVRTYTNDDATKYQIAYRSNNVWKEDANGRALPGSFTTNLQVDRTAINGNVTGGGVNATWTTAATRGPGANGVWTRQYLDDDDTTLGFALPDASWSDLNDRKSNFNSQVSNISANAIAKYFRTLGFGRGSGLSTQEGAIREISRSQGSNNQGNPSEDATGANRTNITALPEEESSRPRPKYQSRYTYYYPIALKANRDQDKLQISVLEYKPKKIKGFKIAKNRDQGGRAGYTSRVLGSVFLPVPGTVNDQNQVDWGEDVLDPAKTQARWIGIQHLEIETSELDQSSYSENPKNRCFACKKELHKHTTFLSKKLNYKTVCDGVNLDDLNDYRPGIQAAKEAGVLSPLALFKFTKKDIRDISRALGFPWWDKPAQPCLSSRFPYGNQITNERLNMVEKAEEYIKKGSISEVRVRCHGATARIEIPKNELQIFCKEYDFNELVNYFSNLGFNCTSLDLEGLISGKLNR